MIEKIKRKSGWSYRARIVLPNKQRKSRCFKRKVDADKWERQMLYQIQIGALHGNKLNSRITFLELTELWFEAKVKFSKSPRTVKNYEGDARKHLLHHFGKLQVSNIERGHASQLVAAMRRAQYEPKTINKVIGLFRQILNYAVDEQWLPSNPLARFPSLKVPPREDIYLTEKEIQQLLVCNNQHWIYPILVVALNTGMRRGELLGLCWDRVNLERGFIEVTRNLTREGLMDTTKTNAKRSIPMNPVVRDLLLNLMRQQRHSERVFVNDKNKPIEISHFTYRHFKGALERAKMRSVRFHDLRHTYASQFMMRGGNIYDLQKIMGHSQIKVTSQYAHKRSTISLRLRISL